MLVYNLRTLCRNANSRTDRWYNGNRYTVCAISFSTPQIAASAGKIAGTAFCHETNSGRNVKPTLTILSNSTNTRDTEVQSTYFAITSIRHSKRNCPNSNTWFRCIMRNISRRCETYLASGRQHFEARIWNKLSLTVRGIRTSRPASGGRTSHALKYRDSFRVETGIKDTPCSLLFKATQGVVHHMGSFKYCKRAGSYTEVWVLLE